MSGLVFDDEQGYADFATFVARARSAVPGGAMRLQASGSALAAYVGVLPGRGLMGQGTVVGLRVTSLAEPADLDTTVTLASLTDRLARPQASGTASATLSVPPTTVQAGWAAMAPPRSGWEPVGSVPGLALVAAAQDGIAEIATGTTEHAGAAAVADLRQRVWARLTPTTPTVVAGGAFAAYVLGFLDPDADCTVFAQGRWTRLSTTRGHVLLR